MTIIYADQHTFDKEVLNSSIPVLVDFWAPWCMPCKMLEPIFEEVSKEYQGRIKFVKVNTDENVDVAQRYYITGIPTLMFFKDGRPVNTIVGFVSKKELTKFIEENM
ncbi:MAG: thioredoxin [Candidatus Calescibacterium sp.]|nr:thioredoxin [Candidatus Calescibacterium sp.]MDW8132264.1 thioredoxin [Candidatus Calescibacterium sp.]